MKTTTKTTTTWTTKTTTWTTWTTAALWAFGGAHAVRAEPCAHPLDSQPVVLLPTPGSPLLQNGIVVVRGPASVQLESVQSSVSLDARGVEVVRDDRNTLPFSVLRAGGAGFVGGDDINVRVDGAIAASFHVDGDADTTAPTRPTIRAVSETSDGACEPSLNIDVDADDDTVLLIASLTSDATLDGESALAGLDVSSSRVVVSGEGHAVVDIAAVDAAGNVSEAVEQAVDFPSGCNTGGPVVGLALPLLWRRRRR